MPFFGKKKKSELEQPLLSEERELKDKPVKETKKPYNHKKNQKTAEEFTKFLKEAINRAADKIEFDQKRTLKNIDADFKKIMKELPNINEIRVLYVGVNDKNLLDRDALFGDEGELFHKEFKPLIAEYCRTIENSPFLDDGKKKSYVQQIEKESQLDLETPKSTSQLRGPG